MTCNNIMCYYRIMSEGADPKASKASASSSKGFSSRVPLMGPKQKMTLRGGMRFTN